VTARRTGRHPEAQQVVVRLTEGAIDDLHRLNQRNREAVRWCLKKILLLERDPEAGEGLLGNLIGFRKLTVGDRHWRIVWRVTHDVTGPAIVDVAEVWAAGARSDSEVYTEVENRIATLGSSPATQALSDVLAILAKASKGMEAAPYPQHAGEAVPSWLADALAGRGLSAGEIAAMTPEQAFKRWNEILSAPRD
jgi:mRNA interferase RelE/StbE